MFENFKDSALKPTPNIGQILTNQAVTLKREARRP